MSRWLVACLAPLSLVFELPAADPPPAAREHVQAMLEEGGVVGTARLKAAREHFTAAKRLLGDDPRLDYAFGLILQKQVQRKAAVEQFQTIARSDAPAAWPAWQALILNELAARDPEPAYRRLDEFAVVVQQSFDRGVEPFECREAAQWIGRVLEGLEITQQGEKPQALLAKYDAAITARLTGKLAKSLAEGRDVSTAQNLWLQDQARAASAEAARQQEEVRDKKAAQLETSQAKVAQGKEAAAKSAEEWKQWYDEQLPLIDKQLGKLEKDANFLQERAQLVQRSLTSSQREITLLEQGVTPGGTSLRLEQVRVQAANYQSELNATLFQLSQVQAQGLAALQQRALTVQQYEKATGQLVKRNADLEKWNKRLATKKEVVAAKPVKKLTLHDQRVGQFASYVALDFEDESRRVRQWYAIDAGDLSAGAE